MYYYVFKNLGFFDFSTQFQTPTILQAGVGHGKTLCTIVREIESVQPIGLDISVLSLLRAKANGLKNIVQGDILALPFADNIIDGIFEVGVVEHLYTDDPFLGQIVDRQAVVESFQELRRVLKPGGKVGFIQPSLHSILPLSRRIDELTGNWDMGFQEDFGLNDFCQLVSLGGFSNISFSVLQAPTDFPIRIKLGDRLLKSFYTITGQYRKAEMTGALFTVVATK
jgi:SAM-dependent methyltransferase